MIAYYRPVCLGVPNIAHNALVAGEAAGSQDALLDEYLAMIGRPSRLDPIIALDCVTVVERFHEHTTIVEDSQISEDTEGVGSTIRVSQVVSRVVRMTGSGTRRSARVVVIGGGFAGITVARGLHHAPVSIVLIDRQNYHLFQPLLYQVATGELEPSNIATPIRKIVRKQNNVDVALGQVDKVDLTKKQVVVDGGRISYDYLVIATGMRQSYFGHDEYKQVAPGLKSLDDALEIRRSVLLAFEEAAWEVDEVALQAKLTFVIVGGGPTGVELAGAIMGLASATLSKELPSIRNQAARVILIDGGSRILATMPSDLARQARQVLERMGVEIRVNTRVTEVTRDGVAIGEEQILADNVFWAAGVEGTALAVSLDCELDQSGRIVVLPDLSIPGHPEVFVVGDAARANDADTDKPVPALAQGAIQTGRFVAQIIQRELDGTDSRERPKFSYRNKGAMAMIGRGNAIAAIGKKHFGGLIGWLAWSLVHVMFLVGFGNKLVVMSSWFWCYLLRRGNSRLITGNSPVVVKKFREPDDMANQ